MSLAAEPLKTHLLMLVANSLDVAGEPDKALDVYRTVITNQPNQPLAYFNMAVTFMVKGQTDSSLKMVEKSMALDPGHPGSRYVCMRNHVQKNNQVPALMMGAIMLALDPTGKRGEEVMQVMDRLALSSSERRVDSSGRVKVNIRIRTSDGADSVWNASNTMFGIMTSKDLTDIDRSKPIPRSTWSELVKILCMDAGVNAERLPQPYTDAARFLVALEDKGHLETFSYWMVQSRDEDEDISWLKSNPEKVAAFKRFVSDALPRRR